jgi:hypothetical protein
MGTNRFRRMRLLLPALAVIAGALALSLLVASSGSAAAVPLSISV